MSYSDWITIWGIAIGIVISTIGSALWITFRIGGLHQQIIAIAKDLEKMRIDIEILKIDIEMLKNEVAAIKYTLGQLIVKMDVLWGEYISRSNKRQDP